MKFGDGKYPTTLVLEITGISMDKKERIKDLNQGLSTLLNNISMTS